MKRSSLSYVAIKGNILNEKNSSTRNRFVLFREALHPLFRTDNDPRYAITFLWLITLMGFIWRLYLINRPIGYDEAYTFINFSSKSFKFILADYHAPNNHILNSLLIGIVYRILGNHEWVVRIPAFIAGTLCIPTSYLAARRFFNTSQALAISAVIAVTPNFITDATNGRGYTLVMLFSLLLANFAGILVREQDRNTLFAYAITGALGFYSIPIFLYPMAGISLWVVVTHLVTGENWYVKWSNVKVFLLACLLSGMLTFMLYSPVIIFGTGFKSMIANDYVKSQTWNEFTINLMVRTGLTWDSWTVKRFPNLMYPGIVSLLISLFFYHKASNQTLPMQLFLVIGAGVMVVIQRVAPLERIWGYLEMFFLFYATAGLIWILQTILRTTMNERITGVLLSWMALLFVVILFTNHTLQWFSPSAIKDRTIAPEKRAAEYIAEHLTSQDTIIAPSPVDLQTAYYLKLLGVPYDVFYQRGHPTPIDNALVVIRSESQGKIKTLDRLIEVFNLETVLDVEKGNVVFENKSLQIISIPAYK